MAPINQHPLLWRLCHEITASATCRERCATHAAPPHTRGLQARTSAPAHASSSSSSSSSASLREYFGSSNGSYFTLAARLYASCACLLVLANQLALRWRVFILLPM